MNFFQRLDRWHQSKTGFTAFGLAELGLSYLFVSLAINSGSLWQWTLGLVFLIGFGRNAFLLVFLPKAKAARSARHG